MFEDGLSSVERCENGHGASESKSAMASQTNRHFGVWIKFSRADTAVGSDFNGRRVDALSWAWLCFARASLATGALGALPLACRAQVHYGLKSPATLLVSGIVQGKEYATSIEAPLPSIRQRVPQAAETLPCSLSHRSASRAAIAPVPAEVTAWR